MKPMKIRRDRNFISLFDENTGFYMRSGVLENGKDTGRDPFMAEFPELLDVGIMGHCRHGRSGLCLQAGVECYQDGLHSRKDNMALDDFREIVRQCRKRTWQFALGGCGDPDQHEHFEEILRISREAGIVPNFTTSGLGMTKETAELCRSYCGAVAVSWYRSGYTLKALKLLMEAGVKTNIHYVLSRDSVEEALDRLQNHGFPQGVNAVVFLLHKPVGLGTAEKVIPEDFRPFRELVRLAGEKCFDWKIGFDSCSVPALLRDGAGIAPSCLDTCEGARWSAYISPDMKMMPCSFDNQELRWAVDLRTYSMEEAWRSAEFEAFREHFRWSCPDCDLRESCMGGCLIRPEIVLCGRRKKADSEAFSKSGAI